MRAAVIAGGVGAALLWILGRGSHVPVATLTWRDGSYGVRPSDKLWLLRAVQAETNKPVDRRRVAQTLLNRFVFLRASGSTAYPTLTDFVRAYAQPVNPTWDEASDSKCEANPNYCTSAMLSKRREARNRTQFDSSTVDAVNDALRLGMTDIHSSSVHYAAPGIGGEGKIQLTPDTAGYNTFWAVTGSQGWPGYGVAA